MRNSERIFVNHIPSMILTVVLTLGMLLLLSMPQVIGTTHAQSYTNHTGWYHGMASIAEKEISENNLKAKKTDDLNMSAGIVVANDEKGCVKSIEENVKAEKARDLER